MKENIQIMLDLETFASDSNAYICQIGACYFNIKTGEIGREFFANCSYNNKNNLFNIDPQNITFWLSQPKEVQEILLRNVLPIEKALMYLNDFCADAEGIWSHSTFDFTALKNAYDKLNISSSNIKYTKSRDIRTLVSLSRIKKKSSEKKGKRLLQHNSLEDCKYQVQYVSLAYGELQGSKSEK